MLTILSSSDSRNSATPFPVLLSGMYNSGECHLLGEYAASKPCSSKLCHPVRQNVVILFDAQRSLLIFLECWLNKKNHRNEPNDIRKVSEETRRSAGCCCQPTAILLSRDKLSHTFLLGIILK